MNLNDIKFGIELSPIKIRKLSDELDVPYWYVSVFNRLYESFTDKEGFKVSFFSSLSISKDEFINNVTIPFVNYVLYDVYEYFKNSIFPELNNSFDVCRELWDKNIISSVSHEELLNKSLLAIEICENNIRDIDSEKCLKSDIGIKSFKAHEVCLSCCEAVSNNDFIIGMIIHEVYRHENKANKLAEFMISLVKTGAEYD